MTTLLDEAITAAQQLPPDQQDRIALLILEELADDQQWEDQFAQTQAALSRLAVRVRADISAGRTIEFDEL